MNAAHFPGGDGRARVLRRGASVALLTGSLALSMWGILAASADAAAATKVTLCHRTDSEKNPYVAITVAAAGAYNGHYTEHKGDGVWFLGHPKEPKWGDIIPPFTYKGNTYSLNWDAAGMAIFNAGCAIPTTSTSSASSSTAASSTAASSTAASSTAASSTAASSTAASSTAASSTAASSTAASSSVAASSIVNSSSASSPAQASSSFLAAEVTATNSGGGAAAGPIPAGANAGLVAVSTDTSTPVWAEALLAASLAGLAGTGVRAVRRGSARSH